LNTGLAPAQRGLVLMGLAERVNLPVDQLTDFLAALEAQPITTRERLFRRFLEAWSMQQREAYDANRDGGDDGYGPER
jgi:hypothetical protein